MVDRPVGPVDQVGVAMTAWFTLKAPAVEPREFVFQRGHPDASDPPARPPARWRRWLTRVWTWLFCLIVRKPPRFQGEPDALYGLRVHLFRAGWVVRPSRPHEPDSARMQEPSKGQEQR